MFLSKAKKTDPDSSCSLSGDTGSSKPSDAPMDSSTQNDTFPSQSQGSFVPTVTAISSTPDLQWMVQPTIITSVSPSPGRAESSEPAQSKAAGSKGKSSARKSKGEQLSPEEEEKKRIRRERNKMAAAKCRNRRRELTDTLQAETDQLEEDKAALQAEIESLLKEKERLEYVLASHKPLCQLPEELDCLFPECPQPLSTPETASKLPEDVPLQDLDIPTVPSTAISGNSDILLCSSAEVSLCDLEPSLDIKDELLDRISADTARSVPDIDLTGSLGITDWETLYKSVASDLEPLSTPVVSTSTPSCSNYLSVFTFSCPELDSLAEGLDGCKGGVSKADTSVDILNSPTLLAL
ncbi:protein c-Fos-like [Carassius gibelio]|uniref:protein c-Fos-like n=1 Tax=Carassius gibelio TaxID=101364 RepID=UPI002279D5C7|nr:protein c-Fos-like [Carassius gibelio]